MNEIQKAIDRAINHIAKLCNVTIDVVIKEIKHLLPVDEDEYVLVLWPDVQYYFDLEGWKENSSLCDDLQFGSSAYFVKKSWYNQQEEIVDKIVREQFESFYSDEKLM